MSSTYNRKDSRDLSECILETARGLFAEHGVDAVSMHQIAKAAGVGQGTLYRRYSQKGELCLSLLHDQFQRLQESIISSLQAHSEKSARERASLVTRQLVLHLLNDSMLMETVYSAIFAGRSCGKEMTAFFDSDPYRFMLDTLGCLLSEAKELEQTAPGVDPHINAHLLISTFSPHSLLHLKETTGWTPDELADHICTTIVSPLFRQD